MSPITVGIFGWLLVFVLILAKIPIGAAMAVAGFLGTSYLVSLDAGLAVMGLEPFQNLNSYNMSVIPLFVLMGGFASESDLGKDFYHAAHKWLGHVRGGLAMATIVACAAFATLCGSSPATAATIGSIALPEMKRFKYDPSLATGCVAAGGTIGILIPPSVIFIIYGIMTEQSIAKLFLAGVLPGIVLTLIFMAIIYIKVRRNPSLAPVGARASFKEKLGASGGIAWLGGLFVVIMGGFFIGWFTPGEAGAIGSSGVLILGLARRKFTKRRFATALFDSVQTSAMIFFIIIGAMIFARFLAVTRVPIEFASYLGALQLPSVVIVILIMIMYLILGCLMDSLAMILLTIPIIYPIIVTLGFDPIWFGVIIVLVVEAGLISPPIGMNVFIIKRVAGDEVSLVQIFKGILPFLWGIIIVLAVLLVFPQLATFLPNIIRR